MLRLLRKMIARMGLAGAVALALAFAAPAFASHTCIDESCAPASQTAAETSSDADDACPDCGPACANGCCHAPHPATPASLSFVLSSALPATCEAWTHAAGPPLAKPAGPERPPRR